MRRGYRFMSRLLNAGKELRERAERAERHMGMGACRDCALWERERECQWGYCHMENQGDLETPWMGLAERTDGQMITTHQNFGCVRFRPKPRVLTASKETPK
jgi:hypothetical protein